ncbi:ABC transporter ATP-binding protein [Sporomusa aerivorans]|uniref:ABC transporter ATP-binding protein n=1 Tax=Sporomusa aerivorans TaxID=204936 RepID=UPI00352ABCDA
MLELQNVRKQFDGKVVLDGIDLTIADGEIVSMLGQSGSGKTTLLNIILGLTPPDSGAIIYNGRDITRVSMKERGFNIVFQDYALFPNLNAYKNIVYGLKNKPGLLSPAELDGIIDFLELRPHLTKSVDQLSGGQKQRVALARTLATKPSILLLDEPLSALDGVIKETIKARIKALTKKYNLTCIIVTHDPEEALTMSDRVLIIDQGKVSQFGTPRQVIHQPENSFIEEFILRQLRIKRDNIFQLFEGCHV